MSGQGGWLVLQEVRRLVVSPWVGVATVFLCAYSAFSVALGVRDLQQHTLTYQELLQQRVEAQLRGTGVAVGGSAEPGLRVIRPPSPGAVIATGIESTLPAAWEFTPAGTEALAAYTPAETETDNRGVGDLSDVIAVFGGLLALWLGVSTVVADRSAGRMAALRVLPVAPGSVAVIRLAGATLALGLILAALGVAVSVTLRLSLPGEMAIPLPVAASMAWPVLCYLTLMFALGAAVGARAREGLSAGLTAVAIWIALVSVLPQVNRLVTRTVLDVPSRTMMEAGRRDRMADAIRLLEREVGLAMSTEWPSGVLPSAPQQRVAYTAVGEAIWRTGMVRIRDNARREAHEWSDRRARADALNAWLDGLLPHTWLRNAMAELAGTGPSTQARWARAIAAHEDALDAHLFGNRPRAYARVTWNGEGLLMAFDRRPAPQFSDLPSFVPPPPLSNRWTAATIRSLGGLMAYGAAVMAAAYVGLRSR